MILTRKQYDKMIENKDTDAVSEYQKTERSWFLGGVRISGTKEQESKIWAAVIEEVVPSCIA